MSAEVEIVVNARDNASGVLGNLGSVITGIESAIHLVGMAFDAASDAIMPFITSASESEQAVARLEGVLRATGGAAGISSEALQSLADGLQGVTRFSDETILGGASLLLTFRNISGETLERTIPAMLDMAEIFGSVDSAAMQLGKALNDPVNMMGALTRAGVTFTEEQKKMIENFVETGNVAAAQNIILTEVEQQVGGLAIAMGQTFAGASAIFQNRLDSIRETIGGPIIEILGQLLEEVMKFMDSDPVIASVLRFFERWDELLEMNIVPLEAFRTALFELGQVQFENEGIETFIDRIIGFVETIRTAMDTGDWTPVWTAIGDAFADGWNYLSPIVDDLFARLFDWMEEKVQDWVDGGGVDRLTNGIMYGLNRTINSPAFQSKANIAAQGLADVLKTAFTEVMNNIEISGTDSFRGFFDGWELSWTNSIRTFMNDLEIGITDGVRNFFNNWEMNWTDWVRDHIIDPIKRALGIASPSTVFVGIGHDIIQGFINGIDSMLDNLRATINTVLGIILDPFTGGTIGTIGTIGGRLGEALDTRGGGLSTPSGGIGFTTLNPGGTPPYGQTSGSTGSGATLNFYGPVYVGSLNELNYDCNSVSPLLQSSIGLSGNNVG